MNEIVTELTGSILRVMLNRPAKKNAMTSAMYVALAEAFKDAARADGINAVLWHAAGDSFSPVNALEAFLKNPPGQGESPRALLARARLDLDKPLAPPVQGLPAGGGGTR